MITGKIKLSWGYACIHMHGTVIVKGKGAVISSGVMGSIGGGALGGSKERKGKGKVT